jgi:hypothetical protein
MKLSTILVFLTKPDCPAIDSVQALTHAVGDRGIAALLAILALPAVIPMPLPGFTIVFGLPMAFLSVQMIVDPHHLWLPARLRHKKINAEKFQPLISYAVPWIRRMETLFHPRLPHAFSLLSVRLIEQDQSQAFGCASIVCERKRQTGD